MNAVSNQLNGHIVEQIDTLDRTLILVLATLVETGHSVVEVGCVRVACVVSSQHIAILSLGVADRCQNTLRGDVATELDCTRQLGSSVPTLDAVGLFEQRNILIGIGVLDVLGQLTTGHYHIEIVAFEVQTHNGAILLSHQLFGRSHRSADHRHSR